MKSHLHLDVETYCDLDLKKVGIYRYVEHPSFRMLCAAWKLDGHSVQTARTGAELEPVFKLLCSRDVQAHAWNAAFETAVIRWLRLPLANELSCTMQRALAYALPGRLEQAAKALGKAAQKDMAGHRLMLRMSRPLGLAASPWSADDYATLAAYCAQDVEAEAAIAADIPELAPEEAELSRLDALMNTSRELRIDQDRVDTLTVVARKAEEVEAARCAELTGGAVTSPGTQTMRLLKWLAARCVILPDTARATVEAWLESGFIMDRENRDLFDVIEVLQIRLRAARASTRKLQRMWEMSDDEGALQGQFQFCGAGRTGRWSGRGVQVQNLPRVPRGFDPDLFCEIADLDGLGTGIGLNAVAPAPILDCVSWSLRSCLQGPPDTPMWSFDFSQIEARVLAWLAGQQDVLDVFRSGEDVYVWAAGQFGSNNRQLGKVLILALGFGMGATKLRETARKNYGVGMGAKEAELFKTGWRLRNARIVQFWVEMELAAKQAVLNPGRVYAVGGSGVAWQGTPRTLQMRLPSGRVLYYHKPALDRDTGNLTYWGTEAGGKWALQRTWGGKLAENATQACARDIMAEAMLRIWRRVKLVPCMSVHDELVYALEQPGIIEDIIREAPPWAGGLPIAGESQMMARYGVAVTP